MSAHLVWLLPVWTAAWTVLAVPLGRWCRARAGYPLALALAVAAGAVAFALPDVLQRPATWSRPWIDTLGVDFALRLDALAALFVLLVLGVGAAVLWYSPGYLDSGDRHARFYASMLGFATAMLIVVLADDLVVLYAGWEATTLASFLLIAQRRDGRAAAGRALLITFAAGLCLLAAAGVALATVGESAVGVLTRPAQWPGGARTFLVLVLVAAAGKSAQLPLHTWLPAAMAAPTPVSAYLHAAAMVKAGVYLLLRFGDLLTADAAVSAATLVLGTATALYGGAAALRRSDLKELLAYSTISQLGFLFALVGLGTDVAITAAVLHVVAHGLFKSGLFLTSGVVEHRLGTRELHRLRGGIRAFPLAVPAALLCLASMAGVPPLLGFVSKEEALKAMLEVSGADMAALGGVVVALAFTVAYSLRVAAALVAGRAGRWHRPSPLAWPVALVAVGGLAAGVFVARLTGPVHAAVEAAVRDAPSEELGLWHGVTPALVTAVAITVTGVGLWWAARRWGERLPGPRPVVDRVLDRAARGVAAAGARLDRPLRAPSPAWHLGIVATVAAVAMGIAAVSTEGAGVTIDSPLRWVIGALLLTGAALTAATSDRLAAVAILGVTGFLVAGWYVLHGGADLALTQLVVDALTVALIVFVFRRLPRSFPASSVRRRAVAAVVAAAVGLTLGAAVYLASTDARSGPAQHYLVEAPDEGTDNVVNAVLTDYRALDTLVETTVLAVAAIGVVVVTRASSRHPK